MAIVGEPAARPYSFAIMPWISFIRRSFSLLLAILVAAGEGAGPVSGGAEAGVSGRYRFKTRPADDIGS